MKHTFRALLVILSFSVVSLFSFSAQSVSSAASAVKQLGSVKTIAGSDMTIATDQGSEIAVKIASGARLLKLSPGQTDLKSATPIQLSDVQVGDRVLVRGTLVGTGPAINAAAVVVMKQEDITVRNQKELLDWQRRSVGGLVKQVDPAAKTITLSVAGAGDSKTVTVATTGKTSFKRYSPSSVKWEDATAASIADVHPGDQLRAKGNKSEDGTQVVAEEIVSGTFRNLSGLITSVDNANSSFVVQDLATKKPVIVKVTPDSQMKKLPSQLAMGLAMKMKTGAAGSVAPTTVSSSSTDRQRGGDLNQLLGRLPAATLADLQKGDAVMIVSTQGADGQPPAAITLLGGVEAILTAAPSGKGVQSFLTPWSLAGAPGGDQ